MYDGYQKDQWNKLSTLISVVANCHRGAKQRAYKSDDFNPYKEKESTPDRVVIVDETTAPFLRKRMEQLFGKPSERVK